MVIIRVLKVYTAIGLYIGKFTPNRFVQRNRTSNVNLSKRSMGSGDITPRILKLSLDGGKQSYFIKQPPSVLIG
jgi:hypothetical protein